MRFIKLIICPIIIVFTLLSNCNCAPIISAKVNKIVKTQDFLTLAINDYELPFDSVLYRVENRKTSGHDTYYGTPVIDYLGHTWYGPINSNIQSKIPSLKRICYNIEIELCLLKTPEDANKAMSKRIGSVASIIPKMNSYKKIFPFADNVWFSEEFSPLVLFTSGNIVGEISAWQWEGLDREILFKLVNKIGDKIKAAQMGKSASIPDFPPSCEKLKISLEDAWAKKGGMTDLGKKNFVISQKNKNEYIRYLDYNKKIIITLFLYHIWMEFLILPLFQKLKVI